jgi:hypothetical protein
MQNELTPEQKRSYENGVRIFARWIARAYIKDVTEQKLAMNESEMNKKEDNNANQGCDRSCEASPPGEDKARSKEGVR